MNREQRRQEVSVRYEFRCGYCGVHEIDAGSWLAVTHFQTPKHGGDDSVDNIVYACRGCHLFKGSYWQIEPERRLLHPLLDDKESHYREQADGTLLALTQRGANHIEVLHLNREELIAHRLQKRERERLLRRMEKMERLLAELEQLQAASTARTSLSCLSAPLEPTACSTNQSLR